MEALFGHTGCSSGKPRPDTTLWFTRRCVYRSPDDRLFWVNRDRIMPPISSPLYAQQTHSGISTNVPDGLRCEVNRHPNPTDRRCQSYVCFRPIVPKSRTSRHVGFRPTSDPTPCPSAPRAIRGGLPFAFPRYGVRNLGIFIWQNAPPPLNRKIRSNSQASAQAARASSNLPR